MIKRRFYKLEHGDRDIASDSSSSSSGSEFEAQETEDSQEADEEETSAAEVEKNDGSASASSGYESENSSGNELPVGLSGNMAGSVSDDETGDDKNAVTDKQFLSRHGNEIIERVPNRDAEKESVPDDAPSCIMKCKSVFKCKICPRIVCLNEDIVRAHLKSKRHARSEKLLEEGRLKAVLNSDGEIENQEIVAERKVPVSGDAQGNLKSKQKGRNRWRKGSRNKRTREEKRPTEDGAKKRRKDEETV